MPDRLAAGQPLCRVTPVSSCSTVATPPYWRHTQPGHVKWPAYPDGCSSRRWSLASAPQPRRSLSLSYAQPASSTGQVGPSRTLPWSFVAHALCRLDLTRASRPAPAPGNHRRARPRCLAFQPTGALPRRQRRRDGIRGCAGNRRQCERDAPRWHHDGAKPRLPGRQAATRRNRPR
jgi:hypothetical protein